jgi:hypothetical protein
MDNSFENKGRSGSRRVVVALASCVFGAALILLALQMAPKPQDKHREPFRILVSCQTLRVESIRFPL